MNFGSFIHSFMQIIRIWYTVFIRNRPTIVEPLKSGNGMPIYRLESQVLVLARQLYNCIVNSDISLFFSPNIKLGEQN